MYALFQKTIKWCIRCYNVCCMRYYLFCMPYSIPTVCVIGGIPEICDLLKKWDFQLFCKPKENGCSYHNFKGSFEVQSPIDFHDYVDIKMHLYLHDDVTWSYKLKKRIKNTFQCMTAKFGTHSEKKKLMLKIVLDWLTGKL